MSAAQTKVYERVKAALDKNPDDKVSRICKRLGLNPGYYYAERKKRGESVARSESNAQVIAAPRAATKLRKRAVQNQNTEKLFMVMGTPSQLAQFFAGQN